MAFAFHAEWMPEGSVWYSWGAPKGSKPTTSVEIPKGLHSCSLVKGQSVALQMMRMVVFQGWCVMCVAYGVVPQVDMIEQACMPGRQSHKPSPHPMCRQEDFFCTVEGAQINCAGPP
eukprot:1146865-Pelagomonas_calceolata.AAC.2